MSFDFGDYIAIRAGLSLMDAINEAKQLQDNSSHAVQLSIAELLTETCETLQNAADRVKKYDSLPNPCGGIVGLPLVGIAAYLQETRGISFTQKRVLKKYLSIMNAPYSVAQFLNFSYSKNQETAFWHLFNYKNGDSLGTFWRFYFRALYALNPNDFDRRVNSLLDKIATITTQFATLGHKGSPALLCKSISSELKSASTACLCAPLLSIDSFALVPAQEHITYAFNMFNELHHDCRQYMQDFDDDETFGRFHEMLEYSACSIIMLHDFSPLQKLQLADWAMDYMNLNDIPHSPQKLIMDRAHQSEYGETAKQLYEFSEHNLGLFWKMLIGMSMQANKPELLLYLVTEIISVLNVLEEDFCYFLGVQDSKKYSCAYGELLMTSIRNEFE